jgi:flavin reductase (DIM6/NTAB) family NADH-FMN oxidoreductase RutF
MEKTFERWITVMKTEVGMERPSHFKEYWPGMYSIFSHYEYVSNVPQPLILITTLKENGNINACFHSWSAFSGDVGGFYAVLTGLMKHTHTYKNIIRDKEFCVNFLSVEFYDACQATIKNNADDCDELEAAGLTAETSTVVKSPRVKEAFLSFECKLHSDTDLSGKGISSMIVGQVVNAAIEGEHDNAAGLCGEKGFMYYVHAPKNPVTGDGEENGTIAVLTPVRAD